MKKKGDSSQKLKLDHLERELVRVEAQHLVAEAQLTNIVSSCRC